MTTGSPSNRVMRLAWSPALFVLLAGTGCGEVLGADEYGFAEPCPAGATRDSEGTCVFGNDCGPLGVPDRAAGTCIAVGVPSDQCATGKFRPDETGGCYARVPDSECPESKWAVPGLETCQSFDLNCDSTGFQQTQKTPVYVREGKRPGADGSPEMPYPTITDGLAHVPVGGAILVGPGKYREDLIISSSDVEIIGCPSVTITGTGSPEEDGYPCAGAYLKATVCVAPAARGVKLRGVTITGPGDGIFVAGGTLDLSYSAVEFAGHYGIRVEEASLYEVIDGVRSPTGEKSPASFTAKFVRVQEATGVGVYAAGATVDLTEVYIDRTRQPLPPFGGEARGVSVRPSGDVAAYVPSGSPGADASPTRPNLTMTSSLISGHAEAGVWISGAESALIETTFIGSIDPDPAAPSGVGIVVEQGLPSGSPSTATIRQCEIARASDAGIDVHNASATIERTTIRDTRPRASDGCSGQGIRVRQDPGEQADVAVRQSLIDESRLAAVHVLNASARIENSILRGSAPTDVPEACALAFGDGLSVESVGDVRAPVVLEHSLVTQNARAAAFSAFSDLTVNSSLLGCSPHEVVGVGSIQAETALCGCGESLTPCRIENTLLESWLARPGEGIWSESTMPLENCRVAEGTGASLQGLRNWIVDRPEVSPVIAGGDGCWRLDGAPRRGDARLAAWIRDFTGGSLDRTAPFPGNAAVVGAPLLVPVLKNLFGPTDLNQGLVWIVVDSAVRILPEGISVESDRGTVVYLAPDGFARDPNLTQFSAKGVAVLANLEPGWITVTLKPPLGLACTPLLEPVSGLRVPDRPLSLRARVERGFIASFRFRCR